MNSLHFILTMTFLNTLTIATINANGMRDNFKRNVLFDYLINRRKFNIALIQETHSEEEDEVLWRKQWAGEIHFSHGTRHSKGVAIFILKKWGYYWDIMDQWIIGGDFNCNNDNKHTKDTRKLIFSNLLQENNISDIWHKLYSNNPGYTPSRIDYIVMSSTLCDQIE